MSDFPQGSDWWKASDGQWYPPETKPEDADQDVAPPPPVEPDGGWTGAAGAAPAAEPMAKWKAWTYAILFLLIISYVLGTCLTSGGDDDGGGDEAPSGDELEFGAFDVCTQFVEDRLKAPGTASFRNFYEDDGEVTVTVTGNYYTVRSSVDAENGFGANIRTTFECEVLHTSGVNYRLIDLTLDE